jgi:three-Cys-motif partner protein
MYVDGFCGPGEYKGGEPGSPIIALQVASEHTRRLSSRIYFRFIDKRSDRTTHLQQTLRGIEWPGNFDVKVDCGEFEEVFGRELRAATDCTCSIPPTFAFLDPFGFSGMPYEIVSDLLSHSKCEAFINLSVDSINRFLNHPSDEIRDHIVRAYGTNDILEIDKMSGDRVLACRMLYQQQLLKTVKFVRYFEMRDPRNHVQYYLFFATNHPLGHLKMKEAMWRVDPDGEFRFSDRTDPNMAALFDVDNTATVCRVLLGRFGGEELVTCRDIRAFIECKTSFLSRHMREALERLEDEGEVSVAERKEDGTPRKSNTFPDAAIVTFAPRKPEEAQ